QIANALNQISKQHKQLGIDAVILTRGGGSLEDLWAFNEPIVAKAIHNCPVPIVAAIGHETDTTIAELVADERAATPTQAAMKLVPDRAALREQLDSLLRRVTRQLTTTLTHHTIHLTRLASTGPLANPARLIEPSATKLPTLIHRLSSAITHKNSNASRTLDALTLRLAKHQPAAVHATRKEHIAGLTKQLHTAIHTQLKTISTQLNSTNRQLQTIAPRQVLARGYSITTTADGSLIRSTKDLKPNDQITTHLKDGTVTSTVDGKAKSKQSKPKQSGPQPSLFNKD
ncbi:MAG: exodeoxyribonuclease VII large subunit, partial [Phycisphaerales bacterium]|nr:exodeoxyribonuclease VII large subunit [Phycisphaerales bacterium]